ncbi:MAG TPA: hypothetical protein VFG21_08070 [Xanthomonadaceae bacterium]|nr:hypothetical protein [Xanthomonadaceae bacterium]
MRVFVAGLLAGIVLMVWGMLAHMVLPLGMTGYKAPSDDAAALSALQASLPEEGVYMLPWMDESQWGDEQAMAAFGERSRSNPYAWVVYNPQGRDSTSMVPMLAVQFATVLLAGVLAAWVVSFAAVALMQRALMVTAMGVFAWVATNVPYWNWYRFPLDFTLAALAEHAIGWFLGGLAIAWWLGRRPAAA